MVLVLLFLPLFAQSQKPEALPSEIPGTFKPVTDTFNYVRRTAMVPMRDGVKLHTVIVLPRGASHAPILLMRTPYDANKRTPSTSAPTTPPATTRGSR